MKKNDLKDLPDYFQKTVNLCDDADLLKVLEISIHELSLIDLEAWKTIGDNVYAPGKWTIKDILQHLIDCTRIFAFRALSFARNESQALPVFSEDDYAIEANAGLRSFEDLITELRAEYTSLLYMYKSFTPEMLNRTGMSFKGKYSVASIAFIVAGHQRWHFRTIGERYMPLLHQSVS
jgi:hypothetical protein